MRGSVLYWYRNHQSSCLVHSAEQLRLSLGEQRMNDMDSMSRESKKDQLRKRVISGENGRNTRNVGNVGNVGNAGNVSFSGGWTPEEDSEEIVRKAHKKVKRRHLVLLILLLILIGGAAGGVYWYNRYFQFENQTVGWERVLDRGDGSFTGYKDRKSVV